MAGNSQRVSVEMTTGVGTISFPHIFRETVDKNDKGEDSYNLQFIIPKSQREDVRAIMAAISKVGKEKWGDKWKAVKHPLRDGDKEADQITEDGQTRGEKYPERLGCFFLNARSPRPVGVVDRQRVPLTDPESVLGGYKVKVALSFYTYSSNGNTGIGCGLNGVQLIAAGEPLGGAGKPSIESMFDLLEDEEDDGLDGFEDEAEEEVEETPASTKRTPAKKTAAKKAAAKEVEEDDEWADLDDLDDSDS